MTQQLATRTALSSGQSLHMRAKRGMMVAAASGSICIGGAPMWLTEQLMPSRIVLLEGETYVMKHSGWICISALAAAEIIFLRNTAGESLRVRWHAAISEFVNRIRSLRHASHRQSQLE